MTGARDEVISALAQLNILVGSKDQAIAAAFHETALLVGSEAGEVARGAQAIAAFFQHLYALPVTIGWDWHSVDASLKGDTIYFFAEGNAVLTRGERVDRLPYRLSGVLLRRGDALIWHQFHGSEPKA